MLALIFVAVLAFLLLCALAGYYISAEKGRGGFEGLLLGLIFGPFGLLLTVLMPTPVARLEPLLPFKAIIGLIGCGLVGLILIGLTASPVTALQQRAAPELKIEPPVSQAVLAPADRSLYFVLAGLGGAAAVMGWVYLRRGHDA
jgi:hypothetical protein